MAMTSVMDRPDSDCFSFEMLARDFAHVRICSVLGWMLLWECRCTLTVLQCIGWFPGGRAARLVVPGIGTSYLCAAFACVHYILGCSLNFFFASLFAQRGCIMHHNLHDAQTMVRAIHSMITPGNKQDVPVAAMRGVISVCDTGCCC